MSGKRVMLLRRRQAMVGSVGAVGTLLAAPAIAQDKIAEFRIGVLGGENAQIIRGAEEGDVFVVRANATDKASGQTQARS